MKLPLSSRLRRRLFGIGLFFKALDGVFEIAGGIVLWSVSRGRILKIVGLLTQDQLAADPHDFIATHLRHAASHLSLASKHFMTFYLLGHGLIKIFLVIALQKDKRWAYPTALVVFGGFVGYQIYRFTLTHSAILIALTAFDLLVMLFIWLEYRAAKDRTALLRAAKISDTAGAAKTSPVTRS